VDDASPFLRGLLAFGIPRRWLFAPALGLARALGLQPKARSAAKWPEARHRRKMLVLAGCVQPSLAPSINAAAARVLDRVGISLIEAPGAGCCGALRFHLNYQDDGRDDMRALIDAWWPLVERGEVEAIVMTASGCGVTVKEYAHLLAQDPRYAEKAARIASLTRDLCEVIDPQAISSTQKKDKVAFQSPCTLQHGQQLRGQVERLLQAAGYALTPVEDAHLCCGSAGTNSLLQPETANELRARKLDALQAGAPQWIATANVGCLSHLQGAARTPVRHWIELLDAANGT
jgi:glycolate oxidase iron-sulfur subunit